MTDEQVPAPPPPPVCQVCKKRHEPGTPHQYDTPPADPDPND